ncbi:hypothetical protein NE237_020124 [Protea cynaroides]|uniref:AAA-type ATPase N-terminal domain-containing protein n=1 Tax=Protea cynaroides TaxID=273540 RepID=A0A9Q0K1C7_9MAGN|nr:hypothetical protein NE237_020124 [Protea cynaroides]
MFMSFFVPAVFSSTSSGFDTGILESADEHVESIYGDQLSREKWRSFKSEQSLYFHRSLLSKHSSTQAKRLKGEMNTNVANLVFNLDNHEEVTDILQGIKFLWESQVHTNNRSNSSHGDQVEETRSFKLCFHNRYRDLIINSYLKHVVEEGNDVVVCNRQRRLYTNNSDRNWRGGSSWTHVPFQHRATLRNLAIDPQKK